MQGVDREKEPNGDILINKKWCFRGINLASPKSFLNKMQNFISISLSKNLMYVI